MQPSRDTAGGSGDEIATLLADARARAQAVIDESVERAEELLRQRPNEQLLERIRRTVSDLALDVRAVHSRLDSIEAALRNATTPPYISPPQPPTYTPPQAVYPQTYPIPAHPSAPAAAAQREAQPAYAYPPQPAAEPNAPPPSAIPPVQAPASMQAPAPPTEQSPFAPPTTPAAGPVAPVDVDASTRTFEPEDGPLTLLVSPVAGFQGLMRVQDALTRVRGVREAGVEAYAQGEARLRIQLADRVDADALAASLAELLDRQARVTSASVPERMLRLALE